MATEAMACGRPCSSAGARILPVFSRTKASTRPLKIVQKPQHNVTFVFKPRIQRSSPTCVSPNRRLV